jgi:hypothetical protein
VAALLVVPMPVLLLLLLLLRCDGYTITGTCGLCSNTLQQPFVLVPRPGLWREREKERERESAKPPRPPSRMSSITRVPCWGRWGMKASVREHREQADLAHRHHRSPWGWGTRRRRRRHQRRGRGQRETRDRSQASHPPSPSLSPRGTRSRTSGHAPWP